MVQANVTGARVVGVVGPTGSGKTALGLGVAELLGGEILNADSRQVYRGLDVGSAKPNAAERARVPHHLFDVADPNEPFDCATYVRLARGALADIAGRGRSTILVGGTGLYLKALRHGLFPGPPRDAELRARLAAAERGAPGTLHERLRRIDPAAADRLHPNDKVRLVRAVEVYELTGRPISAWQDEHAFRAVEVEVRMVGLDMERRALYERLDRRCAAMVEAGLVDEVRELRRLHGKDAPALKSIGYREIGAFLDGTCVLAEAIARMARSTRHLAKRQLTWFRADPTIVWLDALKATPRDVIDALGATPVGAGGRRTGDGSSN